MSNGDNNNKENPRFRNPKVNNKNNLRFSNQNNSLRRKYSSREDKNKNLRLSNHNIHSLKENLKEGMKSIESRLTKSLEKLLSIISVG
jgi:predicted RNase H-like nuclease (RuvC/YqgF family)